MSNYNTCIAEMNDVEGIVKFFNRPQIKKELNWFTYEKTIERAVRRSDRRVFVQQVDGELVAALVVWCESTVLDDDEAQIRLVAVDPEYRDNKRGESLVDSAEEFAVEYGVDKVTADVGHDSPAFDFWKSMGYEKQKLWETDNGREMARMEKYL